MSKTVASKKSSEIMSKFVISSTTEPVWQK